MSWYYGTFSCGHEGRVNITGPTKNRQWIADRKFEELCKECYEKKLEADRQKANEEAEEKAKEMELVGLTGTEKQVAWANTLRQKLIDKVENFVNNDDEKEYWSFWQKKYKEFKEVEIENLLEVLNYILINETTAKFYINNRCTDTLDILSKYIGKVFISDEDKIEEMIKKDVKLESTVVPIEVKYDGIVEIFEKDEKIIVTYEKNEEFRLLVKSLGYKWNGAWEKNLNVTTGKVEDRIAELGNKLLNAGFSVCIYDEKTREKAIDGNFEQENDRWILIDPKSEEKIKIIWDGINDKLYGASRRLPGSIWENRCIKVKVEKYEEILEFAEMYGFNISLKALERLMEYKNKLENIEKVNPVVVEKALEKNGLEDILNSSREILDDLLEEDD